MHCCHTIKVAVPNGSEKQQKVVGTYHLVKSTESTSFWAFKHISKQYEIFRRYIYKLDKQIYQISERIFLGLMDFGILVKVTCQEVNDNYF